MGRSRPAVAVLGGGTWGTALAHLAAESAHAARAGAGQGALLWLRDAEGADEINRERTLRRYLGDTRLSPGVRATTELGEAIEGRALVVFAIPSGAIRQVAADAGAFLTGEQVVLSATKGLEPETFARMSEVIRQETCARKVGALSGPNLAREILAGQPSATVCASRFREAIVVGAELLHGPLFRIYGNHDLAGVELAGALKNVIAIACGAAAGMGFGDNVRALIVTRGLAEIQRLGAKLGADPLTFSGLAGIGDLLATCSSPLSRNFRIGRGVAEGRPLEELTAELGEVAEGINTTRVALELGRREGVPLPILEGVHGLLFDGAEARVIMEDLMTRAARYEIDLDYTAEVAGR